MKPTQQLHDLGQSLWLDNITRGLLKDGTLRRYIEELSITGLTSNPSIFDHAIKESNFYDDAIRQKKGFRIAAAWISLLCWRNHSGVILSRSLGNLCRRPRRPELALDRHIGATVAEAYLIRLRPRASALYHKRDTPLAPVLHDSFARTDSPEPFRGAILRVSVHACTFG